MIRLVFIAFMLALAGCEDTAWNNPYDSNDSNKKIVYTSFSGRPKHLDPAKSYSSNEWSIIAQIYEPPLQYDYYIRPYKLVPLAASSMPIVEEIKTISGETLTIYTIKIKEDLKYQSHPAFVQSNLSLPFAKIINKNDIEEFIDVSTRYVTASDFVYQIKRLAEPKVNSPIYGLMSNYILGLKELREQIDSQGKSYDLNQMSLPGAKVIDEHTYQITIKGHYPQFIYWLAMPFFAPMPYEAVRFYEQEGMSEHNFSLDWYPVGSGPFYLAENNPSHRMLLRKNENFHKEYFPYPSDLKVDSDVSNSGKRLPLVDQIVFSLEKESIPYWNKFIQGYYDSSGVSSDNFNNVFNPTVGHSFSLNDELSNRSIRMQYTVSPSTMYWGFNMLDEVVGGYSPEKVKLRQAISIAIDVEEYISIFLNGRAEAAMHPLPPDFLPKKINNDYLYNDNDNGVSKKNIEEAKKLLAEAGFPNGRDKKTGEQLSIFFEAIGSGDPNERAIFSWLRKQFKKIDVELVVRVTDYNRFQDKMKKGQSQMFFWGWNADYPDVENFLFMFYSKNSKAQYNGENAANYSNQEFDKLFDEYNLSTSKKQKDILVERMIIILQKDAPWVWGYHPHSYTLFHDWHSKVKPNAIARNTAKYINIDERQRQEMRQKWNVPSKEPLYIFTLVCIFLLFLGVWYYNRRQKAKVKRL